MRRVVCLTFLALPVFGCASERTDESGGVISQVTSRYELQPEKVPQHLRHLIPLAEKWGIGDDVERGEFIDQVTAAERQALIQAIAPHQGAITAWLDSFGTAPMTDEAAAFMYTQLAVEEMRSY
jgi:hypothetical protein